LFTVVHQIDMKSRYTLAFLAIFWCISLPCIAVMADEPKAAGPGDDKSKVKIETVLTGLDRPCGVAVRPETEYVYIAEGGAGQIVKFAPSSAGKTVPAVIGLPDTAKPSADSAPGNAWGFTFLSKDILAIAAATVKDDKEEDRASVFNLSSAGSTGEEQPLDYGAANQRSSIILSGPVKHAGEANAFCLAPFDFSFSTLLIAVRRNDDKGGVYKADLTSGHDAIDSVHQLIKAGAVNKLSAPLGMAVSPHGFLTVVQSSADDSHHGIVLSFYQVRNGSLLMSMPLALADVVALAYSPKTGLLYALCCSSGKLADDGLYRLDAGKADDQTGVKAVKLATLEHPSAFAFGSDNALYVCVLGAVAEGAKNEDAAKQGKLLKITGDL
jgi:hypothetical protein